jgi:hypothetical protein
VTATFVAFRDGLAETIAAMGDHSSEQLRGQLYGQLIPASLPLSDYAAWRQRFPLPCPRPSDLELGVLVAGSAGSEATLASLETQSHEKWIAGVIDGPPLAIEPDLVADFLEEAAPNSNVLVVAMAGITLGENALARIEGPFNFARQAAPV